jgi:hypothetical protein
VWLFPDLHFAPQFVEEVLEHHHLVIRLQRCPAFIRRTSPTER